MKSIASNCAWKTLVAGFPAVFMFILGLLSFCEWGAPGVSGEYMSVPWVAALATLSALLAAVLGFLEYRIDMKDAEFHARMMRSIGRMGSADPGFSGDDGEFVGKGA